MPVFEKLVRDRIPELIEREGKAEPITRRLDDDEYLRELFKKIGEEGAEVAKAESRHVMLEELADLEEVKLALLEQLKITQSDIEMVRIRRRRERGGFNNRVFLECTRWKTDL